MGKLKTILLLLGLVFMTGTGYGAEKEVVFTWDKTVIEADLAGFEIEELDEAGVPTGLALIDIPYVVGQNEFTRTETIDYANGQTTRRCYRIRAYDFSGNASGWTLITEGACITVDFEAPGGCLNFRVIINTI